PVCSGWMKSIRPPACFSAELLAVDRLALSEVKEGASAKIIAVRNDEKRFLDQLNARACRLDITIVGKKSVRLIIMRANKQTVLRPQSLKDLVGRVVSHLHPGECCR